MTKQKLLDWATNIISTMPESIQAGLFSTVRTERSARTDWLMRAASFIEAALPPNHVIRRELIRSPPLSTDQFFVEIERAERTKGLVFATKELIENDRLEQIVDSVRVQTESEVLDSAFELLAQGHLTAAAVLGGGALEVHMRRLYDKQPGASALKGDPSIAKYEKEISAARNLGQPVPYEPVDSKNILAWAGFRNAAAHTPTTANATPEQIRLMLEGIREFIARVR